MALLKIFYKERLYLLLNYFFSNRYSINYEKELNIYTNFFNIGMLFVTLISFGVLATSFSRWEYTNWHIQDFYNIFFKSILLLNAYLISKHLIYYAISYIFNLDLLFKNVVFTKFNCLFCFVLWGLPFLIISVYTSNNEKVWAQGFLFFVICSLLFQYAVLIRNNKKIIASKIFYFILYICVLEIAPFVIISKLII